MCKIIWHRYQYPCYGATGDEVLENISSGTQDYNNINILQWLGVLLALAFSLRLSFYIAMRNFLY